MNPDCTLFTVIDHLIIESSDMKRQKMTIDRTFMLMISLGYCWFASFSHSLKYYYWKLLIWCSYYVNRCAVSIMYVYSGNGNFSVYLGTFRFIAFSRLVGSYLWSNVNNSTPHNIFLWTAIAMCHSFQKQHNSVNNQRCKQH